MAMRSPLSPDDAAKLDAQRKGTMDEQAKIEFRIARDQWAEEGHLPEGYSAIEIELIRKIRVLDLRLRSEGLSPADHQTLAEELQKLIHEAGELRQQAKISDGIHREVLEVLYKTMGGDRRRDK